MKRTVALLTASFLTACAPCEECNLNHVATPVQETIVQPVVVENPVPACPCVQAPIVQMPCAENVQPQPCGCALPDSCREVQKPRITEVVVTKPRRQCPMDSQMVNCGQGNQRTFEQQSKLQVSDRVVVPAMPEAYVLASNRTVSRFLKDMSSVYTQEPNLRLYVKQAKALADDLPKGMTSGTDNFKKQIASSYTFDVIETPSNADYYLETTASWFDTPSKSVPAIEYRSVLYDKNNNKVKEWVEIIKKANNTQSWL